MTRENTKVEDRGYLSGKLLIATPSIGDTRFDHSVVLMCDHTSEHAMGIILNKPVEGLQMPAVLDQLGVENANVAADFPVLNGGPVECDRGFVVHSNDYESEGSTLSINPHSESPPRQSLLALGYAGWGPGQIESELVANAWLVVDADEDLIFDDDAPAKWEKALEKIGVSPEHLSSLSGSA
jgi:putative transcriptional regulator